MKYTGLIGALMLATLAQSASAQMEDSEADSPMQEKPAHKSTRIALVGAVTQGGDTLTELDILGSSDEEIKAGELFYAGLGVNYRQQHSSLSLQANLGYHWDSITAENGDVTLSRIALDVLPFWHFAERHRLGVGLVYHLDPTLELDFDFARGEVEFENSLGYAVEYGFLFPSTGAVVSLRYTTMDYTIDGFSGEVDASHAGLVIYAYF